MGLTGLARYRRLGWETYAWLIYSIPFLVTSFSPAFSPLQRWAAFGAYPVFLVLYLAGQRVSGWSILWFVVALDALGVGFGTYNPTAACFLIYASALLGPALPVRQAIPVLVGQVALGAIAFLVLDLPVWFLIPATVISALIGAVTIQGAVNDSRDAKLRLAQSEVERLAKVAERERIARDVHDLLGHTLSVVVLKSELAQKLMSRDAERARQEMGEVERIARAGLAEVREAVTGYRAAGLGDEIEHVQRILASAGIQATIEAAPLNLARAQEAALAYALRESATNVIRHAGASECNIRFHADRGSIVMEIHDNGRGSDAPFGHGLTGMRERIQALGGVLSRDTARGTRILIKLPLSLTASQ